MCLTAMKRASKAGMSGSAIWGWLFATRKGLPSLELNNQEVNVGTGDNCDLTITRNTYGDFDANHMEENHFKILKKGNDVFLEDVSKKGTFIDGALVGKGKKRLLAHNSKISCFEKSLTVYVFMDKTTCDMCNYPKDIKDKYAVSFLLGSGGFGDVLAVFNKKTYEGYAMKIVNFEKDGEKYAKWEAKILRSLNHPCVISMVDIVVQARGLYIILELMEGGDLSHWLQPNKKLTEKQSKLIFYQLTLAVEYLHSKGICHRDLKPENILLMEKKPETLIKVSDFGVSKNEYIQSAMDTTVGTPYYIAPEVLSASSRGTTYTKQVDVWSMGVILFYCLGGALPFRDPAAIMQGHFRLYKDPGKWSTVTLQAQELIDKMLRKDPALRIKIKKILDDPWLQDKEVRETAGKLMGKPLRRRKFSAPPAQLVPKSPVNKIQVPEENRRFSWNLKSPFKKTPQQETRSQPNPAPLKKEEQNQERKLAQPRGVFQFLKRDNIAKAAEIAPKVNFKASPLNKEALPPQDIAVPKLGSPVHRNPDMQKQRGAMALQYRHSPEYKPPKKSEATFLQQAKKNLKPVRKL